MYILAILLHRTRLFKTIFSAIEIRLILLWTLELWVNIWVQLGFEFFNTSTFGMPIHCFLDSLSWIFSLNHLLEDGRDQRFQLPSVQDFFKKLLLNGINKPLEDRSEKYAFKSMLVFLKYLVSTVKLESSKSIKMS